MRLAHKFSVLGEVVAHFRGNVTFPQATPPALADAQCTRCHATVTTAGASGFDHAAHERHGPCQVCHAQTGHDVTTAVLKATGVFNGSVAPTTSTGAFAVPDQGSANLPGHVAIPCSRCHNLAATSCQRCHTPRHTKNRPGACTLCHQPGPAFVFTHPTSEDCNTCHTPSTNHFKPANGQLAPCTRCHTQPGKSWAFTHPGATADCSQCHAPSAKHFKPASGDLTPCTRCHTQPGKSWSFTHPSKSATCTDCHAVPAQHNPPAASASPCTRCHTQPGESWAFTHPGSSANCQSCHTPPAEHAANGFTGQCSLCHHKPGVTFTFTHPSAGEHSYTSRPCAKCHPNGYPEAYCTCHNRAP